MKYGDEVAVCYDGKWGRRVKGKVIKTHNGHHITVRHPLYADEGVVETRFRRKDRGRYARKRIFSGWVRHSDALMPMLFGAPGDWYSVVKWRD